jgi:hypothetical protein
VLLYLILIPRLKTPCNILSLNFCSYCGHEKLYTNVVVVDRKHNEIDIYGTGGMILQNMKNLLECLPGLERLELIDLQLDGNDGMATKK